MDPRSLYTFSPQVWAGVQGRSPVLVHLLEGFVDAGGVTRTLSEQLLEQCEHETVVEFDVDQLHDYRSRRPVMTFDTNRWLDATMPSLVLHKMTDTDGRMFLLLAGPEPDTQWNRAIEAILTVAQGLGVSQLVTASGVPMGVPHTRPLLVTAHATSAELVEGNPVFIDRVSVPGSFGAMLELKAGERGLLARGFAVHVPHYLAQGTFAPAVVRVAELIEEVAELSFPLAELAEAAAGTLRALQGEVDSDTELSQLIIGLEERFDELQAPGTRVPTVDEIGQAVERFLAEQDKHDGEV